jgi:tetratricopeptide (TPR) repeat protein
VKAADNLRDLIAGSGHLQHMPSHIYIRVGRYEDSVIANQKGIEADRQYLASAHPDSIYKFAYVPHNYHFLWFSALMTGQQKIATEAAEKTADVNQDLMRNPDFAGALQHFYVVPLYTDVRFGQWQKILGTPAPETDLKYPTGVWHYARGMAFANQGEQNKARKELAQLQNLMIDPELQELKIWGFNPTSSVLEIASEVLAGEIAKFDKDYTQAINHLRQATTLEDNLVYTEPPDWYSPTHNLLGKILLESDRLVEAEEAFREDLRIYPQNGWSLSGLAQSLKKQGKIAEANTVQQEYEEAWQYADFKL